MATALYDQTFYMDRTHSDWDVAWDALTAHSANATVQDKYTAACPMTGECWQYMGSFYDTSGNHHEFRHRCHPGAGGRRVVVRVSVQGGAK